VPSRANNRADLDSLISSLVDRPGTGPGTPRGTESPGRPTSAISASQLSGQEGHGLAGRDQLQSPAPSQTQALALAPLTTVYEVAASTKPEYITYSKGIQTSESWTSTRRGQEQSGSDDEAGQSPTRTRKRLSKRERDQDEQLRQNLRKEIEAELKALQITEDENKQEGKENFPARMLTSEELHAVQGSDDFLDFVERSTKVIERALEEEYDVLADYALRGQGVVDEDAEQDGLSRGRKGRRIKEIHQFQDERWTKRRMLSDLDFNAKVSKNDLSSIDTAESRIVPRTPACLVHQSRKRCAGHAWTCFDMERPHAVTAGIYLQRH